MYTEEPEDFEYCFQSYNELMEFCDQNAADHRSVWYWGAIENFNEEYYTIQDIKEEFSPEWFEPEYNDGDDEVIIYDFSGTIDKTQKEKLEEFLDIDKDERTAWLEEERKRNNKYNMSSETFNLYYSLCLESMNL